MQKCAFTDGLLLKAMASDVRKAHPYSTLISGAGGGRKAINALAGDAGYSKTMMESIYSRLTDFFLNRGWPSLNYLMESSLSDSIFLINSNWNTRGRKLVRRLACIVVVIKQQFCFGQLINIPNFETADDKRPVA